MPHTLASDDGKLQGDPYSSQVETQNGVVILPRRSNFFRGGGNSTKVFYCCMSIELPYDSPCPFVGR